MLLYFCAAVMIKCYNSDWSTLLDYWVRNNSPTYARIAMIDIEKAIFDPTSVFQSPKEVLNDKELSKNDKISILQHWADDERELLVAEEENMHRSVHERESVLADIQQALECLGVCHDDGHSSATKHG